MEELKIEIKSPNDTFRPIEPESKKPSLLKRIFSFKGLVLLILIFLLYSNYTLNKAIEPVKDKSEGIIDDLGRYRTLNEAFANDLNEVRKYLLLPTKAYDTQDVGATDQEDLKSAVLSFIGSVGQDSYKNDLVDSLHVHVQGFVNGEAFSEFLAEQALSFHTFYPEYDGSNLYTFIAIRNNELGGLAFLKGNIVDGTYFLDAVSEDQQLGKDLSEDLIKTIEKNKNEWISYKKTLLERQDFLAALIVDKDVPALFKEKSLIVDSKFEETDYLIKYKVNGTYGHVFDFGVSKEGAKFFIDLAGDKSLFDNQDEFRSALFASINEMDLRSPVEKAVSEKKVLLEEIFKEKAFRFFLDEFGGQIAAEPKEEPDRFVYDLKRGDKIIGSVILEKGTGIVKVLRDGQEIAVNVFDYSSEPKKKL